MNKADKVRSIFRGLVLGGVVAFLGCGGIGCRASHGYFRVGNTTSMSPALEQGQKVKVFAIDTTRVVPKRFQVVAFRSPVYPGERWAMRVVGLPGDTVALDPDSLRINGRPVAQLEAPERLKAGDWLTGTLRNASTPARWQLGADEVFVVGDNRAKANDSRFWGPLKLGAIFGVVEVPGE